MTKYVSSELKWNQGFYYNVNSLQSGDFVLRVMGNRGIYDVENMSTRIQKLEGQRVGKSKTSKRNYVIGNNKEEL